MMEMKALMSAAADFVQRKTVPKDVFAVLDLWVALDHKEGYNYCFQVMSSSVNNLGCLVGSILKYHSSFNGVVG
jgi:hypothetical protein